MVMATKHYRIKEESQWRNPGKVCEVDCHKIMLQNHPHNMQIFERKRNQLRTWIFYNFPETWSFLSWSFLRSNLYARLPSTEKHYFSFKPHKQLPPVFWKCNVQYMMSSLWISLLPRSTVCAKHTIILCWRHTLSCVRSTQDVNMTVLWWLSNNSLGLNCMLLCRALHACKNKGG